MGHTRLGKIPKSQNWINVIQTLSPIEENGEYVSIAENTGSIARRTLNATQNYLHASTNDLGLRYTFYLLARIALASREPNWRTQLHSLGIDLNEGDSLLEFTAEFQKAIDEYLIQRRYSSDISEMAQQAAGEAFTYLASPKSRTLFGAGAEDLRSAIREFSTKKGFSVLGQKFFGTFISRFINFYVSRLTAGHIGNPNLPHVGELTRFNESLQLHCEQSAKIVYDFCGEWYSKTEYMEGIDIDNTSRFLAVALRKLQTELEFQEADL
jgi:hypothetical protein